MRPELACCTDASLDFVNDEEDVVFLCDFAEPLEEEGGGVVVAAFGLDGFDHGGDGFVVVIHKQLLCFIQASLLFSPVFRLVLCQGVLELGKGGLWPVEGGDVEFVDGL